MLKKWVIRAKTGQIFDADYHKACQKTPAFNAGFDEAMVHIGAAIRRIELGERPKLVSRVQENDVAREENHELRKALRDLQAAIQAVYWDEGIGPGYVQHINLTGTERANMRLAMNAAEKLLKR